MKKTALLSLLLLATSISYAQTKSGDKVLPDLQKQILESKLPIKNDTSKNKLNNKQVSFELAFERVVNNKTEVLNNFTLTTLLDQSAPVEISKTIVYVEGCAVNVADNTTVLNPGTYTYGLKSNVKIHEGEEKDTYLAEVDFDYSDLMSIKKFKAKECEIDLLQKFGWNFKQVVQVSANQKVSVGDNLYPQFRQTPINSDDAQYQITLKVLK